MEKLGRSLEDYLETIYLLSRQKEWVRITDIAESLGVKKPSVVFAVKRLEEKGLVRHEKYGRVELTETGLELARGIYKRHVMLFKFFHEILGVEEKEAEKNACLVEHCLSVEVAFRLAKFVEFMERNQDEAFLSWLRSYREYVEGGELSGCGGSD